jgi:hypothetical protein
MILAFIKENIGTGYLIALLGFILWVVYSIIKGTIGLIIHVFSVSKEELKNELFAGFMGTLMVGVMLGLLILGLSGMGYIGQKLWSLLGGS